MAEKRTSAPAEDTGTAVPTARTAEPVSGLDPNPEPAAAESSRPRKRVSKAAKAGQAAEPTKPAKATAKVTKKATKKAAPETAKKAAQRPAKEPASTAATKATKAAKTTTKEPVPVPAPEAAALPVPPHPRPHPAAPGVWTAAVWDTLRQPGQPPRRLAELAVAELGPRAAAWVGWLRETYPGAPADGIARLALHEAARLSRAVALARVGGPATVPFSLPVTGWVRASVVLRIAAAYGHDPTDPGRVAELLDLLGWSPDEPERSRAAGLEWWLRSAPPVRRLLGRRRSPPVAAIGMLRAAGEDGDEVERLAHRAVRRYRPGSRSRSVETAESISSRNVA